jgi:ubiquinone/menaquinone biosynthesis C-methylase UbiE
MDTKKYFDEVAPRWDKIRSIFFSDVVREKAISLANVQPDKVAADIGAGTGFITEGLIKKGLKVITVEQSEAMLRVMKNKFDGIGEIEYRKGDALNLPIEDNHIDYVFANMLLHHVESPAVAIEEMTRILKPGGILVIIDLDEHKFKFLKQEHHDRWMGFKRDNIRHWFIESGLKEVKVDCTGENCSTQSNDGDEYAHISIFITSGRK